MQSEIGQPEERNRYLNNLCRDIECGIDISKEGKEYLYTTMVNPTTQYLIGKKLVIEGGVKADERSRFHVSPSDQERLRSIDPKERFFQLVDMRIDEAIQRRKQEAESANVKRAELSKVAEAAKGQGADK